MELYAGQEAVPILVEKEAYEGVKRIADTVAGDFEKVTGKKPSCISLEEFHKNPSGQVILCGTIGKSPLLEEMAREKKMNLKQLEGKREVFLIQIVEYPFSFVKKGLVIAGSDKRGTIYGMFALSEYIGVTPLCDWGDVFPQKRNIITAGKDLEQVSKEPSVRYRGFFINDEWPCFGTWVNRHFGGFCQEAYKKVFEFLLRMRGNYLWPAMWSASFPIDGPGSGNEELADIYGVVIGYSHHEPCLRASEEWDKVRGADSPYGNEWNFYTNEKGLLKYWEDGLKRSGKYENIITIGMRGMRDTSMLGEDASLEENISLLKDIIHKQRKLIKEQVKEDLTQVPQLFVLYKEVEQYFYGDTKGGEKSCKLMDDSELEHVILMFCEDNFGYMRTLPGQKERTHKGGLGMYYHLDYHGGPVSYEWVDSTPLSKIWEQMCTAYEYGIREAWIVNAGDIKFHEVPLSYFMALAYDYDKWGGGNSDSYREYTREWAGKNFPGASAGIREEIGRVFTEYIDINSLRRPESLHEGIYHPCHYRETERLLERVSAVEDLSQNIAGKLKGTARDAYYSMVHYPAMASMNLLKMFLYAGKNMQYAGQGRKAANAYGDLVRECIVKDRELSFEFSLFSEGKWDGMQLAPHVGFRKWNEDGCRYPYTCIVTPVLSPRMSVSRSDSLHTSCKNYGMPEVIEIHDFLYAGVEEVVLEVANEGEGILHYTIQDEKGQIPCWLEISPAKGDVLNLTRVKIRCVREKLSPKIWHTRLFVKDRETQVALDILGAGVKTKGLSPMTFLPSPEGIIIGAEHFAGKKDVAGGAFRVIEGYGKYGAGVKVFPVGASFQQEEEKPSLTYRFWLQEEGVYRVQVLTAPTNPPTPGQPLRLVLDNHRGERKLLEILPSKYLAGNERDPLWADGVLNQIRSSSAFLFFGKGEQELSIEAMEPGVVLEQIRISLRDREFKESYLGPEESFLVKQIKKEEEI